MLGIAAQLRDKASLIADSRAPEIVSKAFSELQQQPIGTADKYYNSLRHGALPITQRHRDYLTAMHHYVYHKIRAKRLRVGRLVHSEESLYHWRRQEHWRTLMDAIEFGLSYSLQAIDIGTR